MKRIFFYKNTLYTIAWDDLKIFWKIAILSEFHGSRGIAQMFMCYLQQM